MRWLILPFLVVSFTVTQYIFFDERRETSTYEELKDISDVINRYGKQWMFYAQVDKKGDYVRRMFIEISRNEKSSLSNNPSELPLGTLILMETWFSKGQSTVYLRKKVGKDQWESGSFSPKLPSFDTSESVSCNSCHSVAKKTDQTFTLPLLKKYIDQEKLQRIVCNENSFTPCNLNVYQGD
ncbi:hypothetical protein J8281_16280 [Aquimarina sp. U1-2]|uniref:hypothetical protein n=1 Tax=Aquimarina sp. U1-2 TaxID=2823141 RepID=UPI001AED0109|nr:hypothetical protein [Aquimarina sp. U1-2]MBP2833754.1 hypothetical protein [Aquimarina sp. U1-2]